MFESGEASQKAGVATRPVFGGESAGHTRSRTWQAARTSLAWLTSLSILSACAEPTESGPGLDRGPFDPPTPSAVTVHAPPRAAVLQGGGMADSPVTVSGEACDPDGPIIELEVNGELQRIPGDRLCEPFTVEQDSRWGISIISVRAEDVHGDVGVLAQSFIRSPDYYEPATDPLPSARIERAVMAQLNGTVIDDGDRSDVDDIATLGALILNETDLDSLLPETLIVDPDEDADGEIDEITYDCVLFDETNQATGFKVTKDALAFEAIRVRSVSATPAGLQAEVDLTRPDLAIQVFGNLDLGCLGESNTRAPGRVTAEAVRGSADIQIALDGGGQARVRIPRIDIELVGLNIEIQWSELGIIDFLFDEILSSVINSASEDMPALLEEAMRMEVRPVMEELINGFKLPGRIDLPPPLDAELKLDSGLDWIEFGDGYVQLGLYAQIMPASGGPGPGFGAIRGADEPPSFSSSEGAFSLAIKDDVANQLLWAAWAAGAFEIDDLAHLADLPALEGISLRLSATSPPVVMPGRDGNDIDLGIGDLAIEATVDQSVLGLLGVEGGDPVNTRLFASVLTGASMSVDPETNHFAFELGERRVPTQVMEISEPTLDAPVRDLLSFGLRTLLPQLLAGALESCPIPEFDLTDIEHVPPGTTWRVGNASLARSGSYHRLSGDLVVR